MPKGAITEYMDVAQIVLYAFWVFFAGLIFYLRREDKREGYPLVYDRPENRPYLNFPPIPAPKTFLLADGRTVQAPRPEREPDDIRAVETAAWPGAPLQPIGDPMLAAVGPGAYAIRDEVPDRTFEGLIKIVPFRVASKQVVVTPEVVVPQAPGVVEEIDVASTFILEPRDPDPRGMEVYGADQVLAGVVTDFWVDRSEVTIRYLEVELPDVPDPKRVLLPITFALIDGRRRRVNVDAILGSQFADVPVTRSPVEVTLQEEDKICAYYGGGTLYAAPLRVEPLL